MQSNLTSRENDRINHIIHDLAETYQNYQTPGASVNQANRKFLAGCAQTKASQKKLSPQQSDRLEALLKPKWEENIPDSKALLQAREAADLISRRYGASSIFDRDGKVDVKNWKEQFSGKLKSGDEATLAGLVTFIEVVSPDKVKGALQSQPSRILHELTKERYFGSERKDNPVSFSGNSFADLSSVREEIVSAQTTTTGPRGGSGVSNLLISVTAHFHRAGGNRSCLTGK